MAGLTDAAMPDAGTPRPVSATFPEDLDVLAFLALALALRDDPAPVHPRFGDDCWAEQLANGKVRRRIHT